AQALRSCPATGTPVFGHGRLPPEWGPGRSELAGTCACSVQEAETVEVARPTVRANRFEPRVGQRFLCARGRQDLSELAIACGREERGEDLVEVTALRTDRPRFDQHRTAMGMRGASCLDEAGLDPCVELPGGR